MTQVSTRLKHCSLLVSNTPFVIVLLLQAESLRGTGKDISIVISIIISIIVMSMVGSAHDRYLRIVIDSKVPNEEPVLFLLDQSLLISKYRTNHSLGRAMAAKAKKAPLPADHEWRILWDFQRRRMFYVDLELPSSLRDGDVVVLKAVKKA